MTKNQEAMLESIRSNVDDPDGVSVQMIMDCFHYSRSQAYDILQRKIISGEAVECKVKQGTRWVKAMKLK